MDLCLIDLSGIYWEKWHASAGEDAHAAHDRTLAKVRELASDHARAVVCIDSGQSFRVDIFPSYKAKRPPKPEAAVAQLERVIATLRSDGVPCIGAPGFEADDVIGTLAREAFARGLSVMVASADKDMLQLVVPGISVVSTKTGAAYVTEGNVEAKLGVLPFQVADWLALAGDTSDGIPGAPGVGPKHAADLLRAHGSIQAMVGPLSDSEATGELAGTTPRIAGILRENWNQVLMCRDLTGLAEVPGLETVLDNLTEKTTMSEIDNATADLETADLHQLADRANEDHAEARTVNIYEERATKERAELNAYSDARAALATTTPAELAEPPAPAPIVPERDWALEDGPQTSTQAWKLAKVFCASGMFAAFRTPEACFVAILAGNDLGLSPMAALRGIHVIEGKPTVSADMMMSIILAKKKAHYFRKVYSDDDRATYETHRIGNPNPVVWTFSRQDAENAELWGKKMWKKYPRNMLRARCISELARMEYPDLLAGVYTAEELER